MIGFEFKKYNKKLNTYKFSKCFGGHSKGIDYEINKCSTEISNGYHHRYYYVFRTGTLDFVLQILERIVKQ